MLRGYLGREIWRHYIPGAQAKKQPQWGRILYFVVGLFFVVLEIAYFSTGVDWFNPSIYR